MIKFPDDNPEADGEEASASTGSPNSGIPEQDEPSVVHPHYPTISMSPSLFSADEDHDAAEEPIGHSASETSDAGLGMEEVTAWAEQAPTLREDTIVSQRSEEAVPAHPPCPPMAPSSIPVPATSDHGEQSFLNTLRISAENHKESRTALALTMAQLQKLADDFDLGRIIKMDRPTNTQCNTTDPFKTGQGMFLLRARHAEEYVERLECLHRIIDALVAQGFPCPPVVRACNGKGWTVWGERLVEIHRFVPHDPGHHRDMNRMLAAASTLGDLHTALRKATEHIQIVPPEMRNDLSPRQLWILLQNLTAQVEIEEETHEYGALAIEVCHTAAQTLAPLLKDYERMVGLLPWSVVHGDYHFWNILYRGDQVAGVVDYDFMQERERLFDVAYALQSLVSYLRQIYIGDLVDFGNLRWESARLWADFYDASSDFPLTETERSILHTEVTRIFLVNLVTTATQENACDALVNAEEEVRMYHWLSNEPGIFR